MGTCVQLGLFKSDANNRQIHAELGSLSFARSNHQPPATATTTADETTEKTMSIYDRTLIITRVATL